MALADDMVIGVRDPLGVRPLSLGRLGTANILASETCAFDIIGADFVRDVEPGELIVLDSAAACTRCGRSRRQPPPLLHLRAHLFRAARQRHRRHQRLRGAQAHRRRAGARGAGRGRRGHPGAGLRRARGDRLRQRVAGIPFELGIIRNHYVGRTFIEPTDHIRHLGVRLKHNANRAHVSGKRVVLVDDSIVRGTTSKKIVEMMRNAGATEVHMRISSPPTTHSCFYGIDTPERKELLAAKPRASRRWRSFIGVDSLAFISIDGLYRAMGEAGAQRGASRNSATPASPATIPTALTDQKTPATAPTQLSLLAEPA